jgi:hypothetical protein
MIQPVSTSSLNLNINMKSSFIIVTALLSVVCSCYSSSHSSEPQAVFGRNDGNAVQVRRRGIDSLLGIAAFDPIDHVPIFQQQRKPVFRRAPMIPYKGKPSGPPKINFAGPTNDVESIARKENAAQ